jgi:hypothetical protein
MKFRHRKKIFFKDFGHVAQVFMNPQMHPNQPIVELLDQRSGSPTYLLLENPPKMNPDDKPQRWVITLTRRNTIRVIRKFCPKPPSPAYLRNLFLEIDRRLGNRSI